MTVQNSLVLNEAVAERRGCAVKLLPVSAERCGGEPAYRVWTVNCGGCESFGLSECIGHPVCLQHGAALRAGTLRDRGKTPELTRICTWSRR